MVLDTFLTDTITLRKSNGAIHENIRAGVQPDHIFITDVSIPIEPGDEIVRCLPSGVEEIYVVTEPGYQARFAGIAAHYQIKYRRSS